MAAPTGQIPAKALAKGLGQDTAPTTGSGPGPEVLDREQLLHLSLSDCDDLLIGGYDSGLVRVWIIARANLAVLIAQDNKQHAPVSRSLAFQRNTNQNSSRDDEDEEEGEEEEEEYDDDDNNNGGNDNNDDRTLAEAPVQVSVATATAIAPLVLGTSWQAHHAAVMSVHFVAFDRHSPPAPTAMSSRTAAAVGGVVSKEFGQRASHPNPPPLARATIDYLGTQLLSLTCMHVPSKRFALLNYDWFDCYLRYFFLPSSSA